MTNPQSVAFLEMSLDELAKVTSIDKTRWSRYLTCQRLFKEDTLKRTAEELKLTPSQFLDLLDQKRSTWNPSRGMGAVALRARQQQTTISCAVS